MKLKFKKLKKLKL